MKKRIIACLIIIAVAIVGGLLAKRRSKNLLLKETQYQGALATYSSGVNYFKQGELKQAENQLQPLLNDPQFGPNANMYLGLTEYRQSEKLWEQYVRIYNTRSKERVQDPAG